MIYLYNVLLFLQQNDGVNQIKKKIEDAPDRGYEIGVAIGAFLPFLLLVIIAYLFYYWSKKRRE